MAVPPDEIRRRLRGETGSIDITDIRARLRGEQTEECPEGKRRNEDGECVDVIVQQQAVSADATNIPDPTRPQTVAVPTAKPTALTAPAEEPEDPEDLSGLVTSFTEREIAERTGRGPGPKRILDIEAGTAQRPPLAEPTQAIGPARGTQEIQPEEPGVVGRAAQQGLVALGNVLNAAQESPSFTGKALTELGKVQTRLSNLVRRATGGEPLDDEDLARLNRDLERLSEEYPATAGSARVLGTMAPIIADLVAFKKAAGAAAGQTTGRTSTVLESLSRWTQPTALQGAGVALGEETVLQGALAASGELDPSTSATGGILAAAAGAVFPGGRILNLRRVEDVVGHTPTSQFRQGTYHLEWGHDVAPVRVDFDTETGFVNVDIMDLAKYGEIGPAGIRQMGRQLVEDLEAQGLNPITIGGFRIGGARVGDAAATAKPGYVRLPAERFRPRTEPRPEPDADALRGRAGGEESAAYIEYQRDTGVSDYGRPIKGGTYSEVLTRNTKSDKPWRITQLRNSEPVFHQEFGSYDEARRALNELADEHNAIVKPIEGRVVTKDQLLNDPRAGFLLLPDPSEIAQRVKRAGVDLLDAKLPGNTSLRREFAVEGDLPKPIFGLMIKNNSKIRSHVTRASYIIKEMDRAIDDAVETGAMEREFADVMVNTALNARGREALLALPAEVRPAVEEARAHIDALTQRGIDLGLFAGDRQSVYVQNKGIYLNRAYEAHDNPRWAREHIPPEVVNQAKSYLRTQDAYANLTDRQLDTVIDRLLYQDEISPMVVAARKRLGQKDMTAMRRRFLDSKPIRDLLGEYEGGQGNYARSIFRMVNLVENHNFLTNARDVLIDGGWASQADELNPNHITRISAEGSEVMAPLNGLYTTPEIKRAFEEAVSGGIETNFPAWLMKPVGLTKYGKTAGSVQTHIRNVTSASMFAVASGHLNPLARRTWRNLHLASRATTADLGRAGPLRGFQAIRGLPDLDTSNVVRAAVDGQLDLSDGGQMKTLFNRMTELGVTYEGARYGEFKSVMDDALTAEDPTMWMNRRAGRPIDKVLGGVTDLYRAEDDVWKVHGFLQEFQNLRNVFPTSVSDNEVEELAAQYIRNAYPTYSLAPLAARRIRGVPFIGPFATFTTEIVRTSVNLLENTRDLLRGIDPRTGEVATDEAVRQGLVQLGQRRAAGFGTAMLGTTVVAEGARQMAGISRETDKDYRQFLPPWSQNGQILWLEQDPENGRLQYIDISYSDPYNYLKRPWIAMMQGGDPSEVTREVISEIVEPIFGIDIFTAVSADVISAMRGDGRAPDGSRIFNKESDPLKQVEDIAKYMADELQPGTVNSAIRIAKGFEWITDENGRSYDGPQELLAAGLGARISTLDIPQSLFFRSQELSERLANARQMLTSEAYRRGPTDPDDISEGFQDTDTARRELYEEFSRLIQAARVFGLSDRDIRQKIEEGSASTGLSRLSGDEIDDLMRGRYHPWAPDDLPRDVPDFRERERQLRDLRRGARGTGRRNTVEPDSTVTQEEVEEIRRRLRGGN